MGKQLNFFFLPLDLLEFEQAISAIAPLKRLASIHTSEKLEFLDDLGLAESSKSRLKAILARPEDVGAVVSRYVEKQGYWVVDTLRSPVVEISRCYFDGKRLRRGRLFYDMGFYDVTNHWVDKSTAFLVWAESILKLAKNMSTYDAQLGSYLGPAANRLVASGEIALVSI